MYKINYLSEKIIIVICNIIAVITIIALIIMINLIPKDLKYIGICILILLFDFIVWLAAKKTIEDKKWLSKNGKIVRNLPFKREKIYDEFTPSKRSIEIKVKYKVSQNKEVEFTKTFSRFEKVPNQAIDLIYDENNPEYRYYLGFDIEEMKE